MARARGTPVARRRRRHPAREPDRDGTGRRATSPARRARRQVGRRRREHLANRVVELAHAPEPGRERDVGERQLGRLDEHARGLRALGAGQRERTGADLGGELRVRWRSLNRAGGRARARRSRSTTPSPISRIARPTTSAPPFHSGDPGTRPGRQRRQARKPPVAAAAVGKKRTFAALRRQRRAERPAVDAGRRDGRDEPAVEPRVAALHRPVAPVEVLDHRAIVTPRVASGWRKSDIAIPSQFSWREETPYAVGVGTPLRPTTTASESAATPAATRRCSRETARPTDGVRTSRPTAVPSRSTRISSFGR